MKYILDVLKKDFIGILKSKEYKSIETGLIPEKLVIIVLERNNQLLTKEFFETYTLAEIKEFLFDM
jgi:hypothetical protein